MSQNRPTVQDIYDAFFAKVSQAPSFKTKSQTWESYINDTQTGRPAMYVNFVSSTVQNSIDGLPGLYSLVFEIQFRADRTGLSNQFTVGGPSILLPLEAEIRKTIAPPPNELFQTLGFNRGWVMHTFFNSSVYLYDLMQDDDVLECIMEFVVLCAPDVMNNF